MKIVILLFASLVSFGIAVEEAVRVAPASVLLATTPASELEAPVMDVVLDTVEITAVAPAAIAVK